jgi:hypothetical protein
MVVMITTQTKDGLYLYQHLGDVFFLFAIKVFGCFHQQTNNYFLTMCGMVNQGLSMPSPIGFVFIL